jgi:hypothetical protein
MNKYSLQLQVIGLALTAATFLAHPGNAQPGAPAAQPLTTQPVANQEPASAVETPASSPQGPAYTPKYRTDPARSDSEFAALAYMRVVMRAEVGFKKQYGHYATSLSQLVHSGTFTQRMVNPDRGDYTVGYKAKKDDFILTMTPKQLDAQHRSFYAEDDGKIHADEAKAADGDSTVVETHHW